MVNFFLVFFSLIFLIILHELSHFLAAKRFGVPIEECGIGYPPRIFAKKFGGTFYSLNLLPFGAFVRLSGEIGEGFFSSLSLSKRMVIVLAGVVSFWIIASFIFIFLFKLGMPTVISDEDFSNTAQIQIIQVAKNSPAQISGLQPGDVIKEFKVQNLNFKIERVKELQELTQKYKGEKVILKIERGKEIFEKEITPRVNPPEGEGPMGIVLVRVDVKKYSLLRSIFEGLKMTVILTWEIIKGYLLAIKNLFEGVSPQVQLMGPVGILNLMYQTSKMGIIYFFHLLALISLHLAIFNLLPIPALDGGKLLFLTLEGVRKRPVSIEMEKKITALFFGILVILAILVTIKDIQQLLY
jgi:regulator of sigma E protease